MSQYFLKPYKRFEENINVKVDLSNYVTKTDLKNISNVDTWSFALKSNLASLKTEIDKLDIDKLVPVPVSLSKLNDVAKNDVVKIEGGSRDFENGGRSILATMVDWQKKL